MKNKKVLKLEKKLAKAEKKTKKYDFLIKMPEPRL